jgi:sulfonate transport system substrate-binding protein
MQDMKTSRINRSGRMMMIVLATLAALAGCGKQQTAATSDGAQQASRTAAGTVQASLAAPKEKVVVNIGVQGKTGIFNFAREKGYFEKALTQAGAEVKWTEFASGPPHFEAIASGRLDFGAVGGTPVISAQTGGVDFKAIAVTSDGKTGDFIVIPE